MRTSTCSAYNLGLLFDQVSSRYSDRSALKYRDESCSYHEINRMANQLAGFLKENRQVPGDVVAIVNTKKMHAFALMLACLKSGIAYTNIDRDNPVERTRAILDQCQPGMLFSDVALDDPLADCAASLNISVCHLSSLDLTPYSDENVVETAMFSGARIAYIMFTSGSTGIPKGVAVTHQNVLSFINWAQSRYQVTSSDIFANISPLYFDNSVFDFYTALFSGACLAPVEKEMLSQHRELVPAIDDLGCTIWFSVPSMLIYLLTMRVLTRESFKSLRVISFGGEGFPKPELKKLFDLFHDRISLINVYGPTEGTCICSSDDILPETFDDMEGLPSLGGINPNFEYVIIDEENRAGKKGELALLGPNIAIGYYRDAERTAQSFSLCNDYGFYGVPIYRTGDLVYENEGKLYFIGRKDNQIKHMGYRIELEEIELALCRLKNVNQAAVLYERVSQAYGKIVAFVAVEDTAISQNHLRKDLSQILPDYMIPNTILLYDVLPKNPNGKIDRHELRRQFNQQQK